MTDKYNDFFNVRQTVALYSTSQIKIYFAITNISAVMICENEYFSGLGTLIPNRL